jgi:hypothetical protein
LEAANHEHCDQERPSKTCSNSKQDKWVLIEYKSEAQDRPDGARNYHKGAEPRSLGK